MADSMCLMFSDVIEDLSNNEDGGSKPKSGSEVDVTSLPPSEPQAKPEDRKANPSKITTGSSDCRVMKTKFYVKGKGPATELGSPLDWMMDFDLDEDEILKSQSAIQCMKDNDAASDLQKLSGEEKKAKAAEAAQKCSGSKRREAFRAPQARKAEGRDPPPPPKKKWRQTQAPTQPFVSPQSGAGAATSKKDSRGASEEKREGSARKAPGEIDQQGDAPAPKREPGVPKPPCARKLVFTSATSASDPAPIVEGEEISDPKVTKPPEDCLEVDKGALQGSKKSEAAALATLSPGHVGKRGAPAPSVVAAIHPKEVAPQNAGKPSSSLLQSFQTRVSEIDQMNSHIDAKTKHIAKLMDHGEKVKENAATSIFNSSKSHVTLITSASKILRRVSPLRSRQVTYANHVCLLLHQRLTGVLNEAMASLQDIKTLANLV